MPHGSAGFVMTGGFGQFKSWCKHFCKKMGKTVNPKLLSMGLTVHECVHEWMNQRPLLSTYGCHEVPGKHFLGSVHLLTYKVFEPILQPRLTLSLLCPLNQALLLQGNLRLLWGSCRRKLTFSACANVGSLVSGGLSIE